MLPVFKRILLVSAALFLGMVVTALFVNGMIPNLFTQSATLGKPDPVGGSSAVTATVSNRAPEIHGPASVHIAENSPPGTGVGSFTVRDPDGSVIAWSLEGTDAALFAINSAGEVTTAAALDYEENATRTFAVQASDEDGASDRVSVTVTIIDVDEPPPAPGAPAVTAVYPTALEMSWQEPANTGPQITGYDVQYRPFGNGAWMEAPSIPTITITIMGLSSDTAYTIQVRARNDEGTGPWSAVGMGSTARGATATPQPAVTPEPEGGQGIGLWVGPELALLVLAGVALIVVMLVRRGH